MRNKSTLLITLSVLCLVALAAEKPPASNQPSPLVGTWELVSSKWGDAEEFSPAPTERRQLKFVTPTHFIWAWVDAKSKKITNSMGGTWKHSGNSYIEVPEFAFEGMEAYVGKEQKFTLKIEGDKWTHSGVLSEGQKIEEIWQRVK